MSKLWAASHSIGSSMNTLVDLVALVLVDIPPSAYFPSGYGFHPCSSGSCCRLDILSFRGVRISYSDQQVWVEKQMDEGVSFSLGVCDIFRRADSGKLSRRAPPPFANVCCTDSRTMGEKLGGKQVSHGENSR
jgi:hypothetical protein